MEIIAFAQNYIFAFLLVLSVLVFVHEFGHYWVARRCGVRVEVFSIGFGREIFGWNDKHGTRWKFSILPLGGYVKMYGDADESSARSSLQASTMTAADKAEAFFAKPVGQRAAIVFAGPATNYLFAILIMTFLFMLHGQPYTAPVAAEVMPNSAAAAAGIQPNDRVLRVDGTAIQRFQEIQQLVSLNRGTPMQFTVLRDGEEIQLTVTPQVQEVTDHFGGTHQIARVGIAKSGTEYMQHGPVNAVTAAVTETYRVTVSSLVALGQIIVGTRGTEELGGPLRIAKMSGDMAELGLVQLVWFMALLSISLGLINLFPIPMLDGGHLVYYAYEAIMGKPMPEKVQEMGLRLGFGVVLGLMVFATWNDLIQLRVFSFLGQLLS